MSQTKSAATANSPKGFLGTVERIGNALPDPAVLFIALLGIVWILSWLLSYVTFDVFHPATGERIVVVNQLAGENFVQFMATMVERFMTFGPVGVVLVAMLGIGVAEHSGFITTAIRALLNITPKSLLTPMVILVGIISHSAVDAGYVLVIPIGGVIFYAAGRHPLAGIAAAFAGVSGGFSANFVPSSLDPLLQGLTLQGAQLLDPNIQVNVLNNYYFTTASSLLITGLGWYLTDKVVEPRLAGVAIDGDAEDLPELHPIEPNERKGLRWALISMLIGLVVLAITLVPADSPWRDA
ncbi:MAG: AbgT family transporter, partial [Chromatiales bacterium]|nr:AbgT family transporter [Chromatiales bacterium]